MSRESTLTPSPYSNAFDAFAVAAPALGLSLPTSRALGRRPRAHASTRSVFAAVPADPDMSGTHDAPIILGSDWNSDPAQQDKATRCSRRLASLRDKSSVEAAVARPERARPAGCSLSRNNLILQVGEPHPSTSCRRNKSSVAAVSRLRALCSTSRVGINHRPRGGASRIAT